MLRGGDWEVGLRIARNVAVDKGNGGRASDDISSLGRKSLRQFADEAGVSRPTVATFSWRRMGRRHRRAL